MPTLPPLNYISIIGHAAKVTWQNKFLWIFGFFLMLGNIGRFSINIRLNESDQWHLMQNSIEQFFMQQNAAIIAVCGILLLAVAIALIVIAIFARAGLITAVNHIERDEQTTIRSAVRTSRIFFWRLFFLSVTAIFALLAAAITLFLPIGFLFSIHATAFGFFSMALAILIFIPLVILVRFLVLYAQFYIVLGDLRIRSALEQAYNLFRKNIGKSILFAILLFITSIVVLCATLFILLIVLFPFLFLGFVSYLIFQKIGAIVVATIGIIVLLAGFLFIRSIFEAFRLTAWALLFRAIARAPEEPYPTAALALEENSPLEQKLPTPENA